MSGGGVSTEGQKNEKGGRIEMRSATTRLATKPLTIRPAGRTAAVSPLRYPGGKAALAGFFRDVITRIGTEGGRYVEPYAGGAGAGVVLLSQGVVDELVINDIDPAVHAFWHSVVNETEAFVTLVQNTPLTVDEWRKQKAKYRTADETDSLGLGFAFFYLNRTNRSGILNAGPIGGVNQTGKDKIDARYNRDQLVARIRAIGRMASQITVLSLDGLAVVRRYANADSTFMYVDPPYVDMGGSLYLNAFSHRDHADLASALDKAPDGNWIVTYDVSDFIRSRYTMHDVREYQLSYSAHRIRKASELLIASRPVARVLADHG
ncbi:DNA adenine methylase [Gordonia sp. NPDC003422]